MEPKHEFRPIMKETVVQSRSEQLLSHEQLAIEVPSIDALPHSPLAAVLVLGMGPVHPALRGKTDSRRVVIDDNRMRHNAMATVELAARGFVQQDGLIIASGKPTANAERVREAYEARQAKNPDQDTLFAVKQFREWRGKPVSEQEFAQVLQTPESDLMTFL